MTKVRSNCSGHANSSKARSRLKLPSRPRPEDIEKLDDVLTRMKTSDHPSESTIGIDREFHTSVAGILGNAVLVRFIGEMFDQRFNPYFERLSSYFENRQSWQAAIDEHVAVRNAIAAHDPAGAKAAMQEHLRLSQQRFSRNFGDKLGAVDSAK